MKKIILLAAILIYFSSVLAVDFKSVYFAFWTESVSGKRGETIVLPVNIKNFGILTDRYIVITSVPPEYTRFVSVVDRQITSGEVKFNEIQRVPVRILFLTSSLQAQLNITIQSEICSTQTCPPLISPQSQTVYVRAGVASLPDFNAFGILIVMIISSLIFYKKLY